MEHLFTSLIHSYSYMPDIHRNQELLDNGYISVNDLIKNENVKIYSDGLKKWYLALA